MSGPADGAPGLAGRDRRLAPFRDRFVDRVRARLSPDAGAPGCVPWPPLAGVVVVLFTSRTGSTYLSRHAHAAFRVPHVGERLNAPQLHALAARRGLGGTGDALRSVAAEAMGEAGWLMAKAGGAGIVSGELHGLFDRYLDRTAFVTLLRRDLLAQAISEAKARLTGRYHSNQAAAREAREEDYDGARIAALMRVLLTGCRQLEAYVAATGRPARALAYEDFDGDRWQGVDGALLSLGLPARPAPLARPPRAVERLDRGVNEAWRARFMADPPRGAMDTLAEHAELVGRLMRAPRPGPA